MAIRVRYRDIIMHRASGKKYLTPQRVTVFEDRDTYVKWSEEASIVLEEVCCSVAGTGRKGKIR